MASNSTNQRKTDLAMIHIAKKHLQLDDDTYRAIICNIGGTPTGSSADLSATGRSKVLAHFKSKGWRPRRKKARARKAPGMAPDTMISKIRYLWLSLADAGVIQSRDEASLRAWVQSATAHIHPDRTGYQALEFLTTRAASNVIEQLKRWADRSGVRV